MAAVLLALVLGLGIEPPPEQVEDTIGSHLPTGRRGPPPPRAPAALSSERDGPARHGLEIQRDGSMRYVDPEHRFTAVIEADGRVRFADRMRKPSARDSQHGRCCGRPPEGVGRAINPFVGVAMRGPYEWMLASRGRDPLTGAKLAFLQQTEAMRSRMMLGWYRQRIDAALRALPRELLDTWTDRRLSLARRRALLFMRWDDCVDDLPTPPDEVTGDTASELDRRRAEAAARARRTIEAFVRRHLPAGTGKAFARTELARLNRSRASAQRFAPYRARTEDPRP